MARFEISNNFSLQEIDDDRRNQTFFRILADVIAVIQTLAREVILRRILGEQPRRRGL